MTTQTKRPAKPRQSVPANHLRQAIRSYFTQATKEYRDHSLATRLSLIQRAIGLAVMLPDEQEQANTVRVLLQHEAHLNRLLATSRTRRTAA